MDAAKNDTTLVAHVVKVQFCIEYKTGDQHVKMVTEIDGQRWNLEQQLRVVDVDCAIFPDSVVVYVPQVYTVPVSIQH